MKRPPTTAALFLALAAPLAAAVPSIEFEKQGNEIHVTRAGEPFAVYHTDPKYPKPFFNPVRAPGGGPVLTRDLDGGTSKDHPHHKGLWVSIDEVNEVDFWAEKGKIENVSVETKSGTPGKMVVTNHWLGEDGKPIAEEKTEITIHPSGLMEYDITFRPAGDEPVTFGDTKEGLFGFRMVDTMRERDGGHVVTAEGAEGSSQAWGKPAAWIDYYGPVEGKTYGVALFDHPENFRPSRYHVRNYGLFSISPFGEKAYTGGKQQAKPVTLKPGETLNLQYAIYLHEGDTTKANVAEVYRNWLKN